MTKQVSFKFEAGLLRRVDEAAQAAKLNRSQLVFRLLEQGLANSSQPTLGVDSAPAAVPAPAAIAEFTPSQEAVERLKRRGYSEGLAIKLLERGIET